MTLGIIKQILDNYMDMPEGRVWAYNVNQNLPKDENLFIVLAYRQRTPMSNKTTYQSTPNALNEVQTMNILEDIIISCVSQNNEARERAHEVHLAMNSTISRQLQAQHKMHISTTGPVYDASFLEATSRLNRFDCLIRVFRSYEKINNVDYYDKFRLQAWVENQNDNVQKSDVINIENTGE